MQYGYPVERLLSSASTEKDAKKRLAAHTPCSIEPSQMRCNFLSRRNRDITTCKIRHDNHRAMHASRQNARDNSYSYHLILTRQGETMLVPEMLAFLNAAM